MSLDANKQLYRRWLLELWNGNLAVTDQVVTADFVGSWPGRPGLVHGPSTGRSAGAPTWWGSSPTTPRCCGWPVRC
jgi:hypothetical protein